MARKKKGGGGSIPIRRQPTPSKTPQAPKYSRPPAADSEPSHSIPNSPVQRAGKIPREECASESENDQTTARLLEKLNLSPANDAETDIDRLPTAPASAWELDSEEVHELLLKKSSEIDGRGRVEQAFWVQMGPRDEKQGGPQLRSSGQLAVRWRLPSGESVTFCEPSVLDEAVSAPTTEKKHQKSKKNKRVVTFSDEEASPNDQHTTTDPKSTGASSSRLVLQTPTRQKYAAAASKAGLEECSFLSSPGSCSSTTAAGTDCSTTSLLLRGSPGAPPTTPDARSSNRLGTPLTRGVGKRGKAKEKMCVPLTKFGNVVYDILMKMHKRSRHLPYPNRHKKKNPMPPDTYQISVPEPTLRFLRKLTEYYMYDQTRVGLLWRERMKQGKLLPASLENNGKNRLATAFCLADSDDEEDDPENEPLMEKEDGSLAPLPCKCGELNCKCVATTDEHLEPEERESKETNEEDDNFFTNELEGTTYKQNFDQICIDHGAPPLFGMDESHGGDEPDTTTPRRKGLATGCGLN